MAEDLAEFGRCLKAERERVRWSQATLARELEDLGHPVTGSVIGAWERGENAPGREKVFALEQALGCNPGWLSQHLGYLPPGDQAEPTPLSPEAELLRAIRQLTATVDRLADRLPPPAGPDDGPTS